MTSSFLWHIVGDMTTTPTTSSQYHTSIETIAQVKYRQVLWLGWMKEATKGLNDDDQVITITQRTPFGNYLIEITRLPQDGQDVCDCGSKYWDLNTCHSCGQTHQGGQA